MRRLGSSVSRVDGGVVYGGTLTIGNFYPETVTNLYLSKARLCTPTADAQSDDQRLQRDPKGCELGRTSTLAAIRNKGDSSSDATTLCYYYWGWFRLERDRDLCSQRWLIDPRCNVDSIVRRYDAANRGRVSLWGAR